MEYQVLVSPTALKELAKIPKREQQRIRSALVAFADTPCPPGCIKLTNSPYWRMREGDWRIVYEIDDPARTVTVLRIRHRSKAYR